MVGTVISHSKMVEIDCHALIVRSKCCVIAFAEFLGLIPASSALTTLVSRDYPNRR